MEGQYICELSQKNGAENRIRTDDLRITNALLYQLSYLGIKNNNLRYSRFICNF